MRMGVLVLAMALASSGCDDLSKPPPSRRTPAVSPSAAAKPAGPKVYERVVVSPMHEVDKIYKSMRGPHDTEQLVLEKTADPELLWIVGFEAIMVGKDGKTKQSQEFMCHSNLDIDATEHQALFGGDKNLTGRLFTLSQGQYRIDMPAGYGIPVLSSEVLSLNTQVLNLNLHEGKAEVRHRVVMRFLRDKELTKPVKALFSAGAYGLKLLDGKDGHYGLEQGAHDHEAGHTACLPGANAGFNTFEDGKGRTFSGHWVVEPGREVNHTRVTELMDLPFDTTLHYVAVHLHPFAETLELKDLTSGTTVYKAKTRQADKGIGLAHVDFFSNVEGVPLSKDHEYELVSTYNNTSGEAQDSMAVMNLYLLDKEFKKPDLSKVKAKMAELKAAKEEEAAQSPAASSAPSSGSHHHKHGGM